MSGEVQVGVIGTGHWGRNLLRNFHALGALGALCDTRPEARGEFAPLYPDVRVCGEASEVMESDTLDAVVIATPAPTHGALVDQALDAGKHVFVEKPLCLELDEAHALDAKARRLGRTLMVGHLLLYHPAYRAIHEIVERHDLGNLRYLYSHRLSLGKIRRHENALWSFAPHDISMILGLIGRLPEFVTASGANYLQSHVADSTLTHMSFSSNVQAHIFVSWLHPFKDHRLVVVGSEAMVVFDDLLPREEKVRLYRHRVAWKDDIPEFDKAESEPVAISDDEPLRLECETFLDCVATGASPPSNGTEAIQVLTVLDASQRAILSGQRISLAPEDAS